MERPRFVYQQIHSCKECIFCKYDSFYSMTEDSGFVCDHPEFEGSNSKIIEDNEISDTGVWPFVFHRQCPLPQISPVEELVDGI